MTTLQVENLSLGYGGRTIVDAVSTAIPTGKVTTIVGANGCGKSTLLRGMARVLVPRSGRVLLGGEPLTGIASRRIAQVLTLLPQSPTCPDGISVVDLVGRGRSPYRRRLRGWTDQDETAVARALELTDTAGLAHQPVSDLSGGQRQRVWVAMALAQDTELLLLDEPTTYLDLAHQIDILDLLLTLNREAGRTVVMVLHELNLAARYADHLIAMKDGRIVVEGTPDSVLNEQTIRDVFGLAATVVPDPVTGAPMVVPLGRPAQDVAAVARETVRLP